MEKGLRRGSPVAVLLRRKRMKMGVLGRRLVPCLALLGVAVLASCGPAATPDAVATTESLRPISVEEVSVTVGVGSPIPVEMVVAGTWPDLCAQLAEVRQTIDGYKIRVTLLATPADAGCPPDQLGVPFRLAIPLNIIELPDGEYTIEVNGLSTTFVWPQSP
jgi:hypothetical protein